MPVKKSAAKRMRTNLIRNQRNKHNRSRLRTALKKVRTASEVESARKYLMEAESLLDKFATKKLIHRNTAARHKSRLHKLVQGMEKSESPA